MQIGASFNFPQLPQRSSAVTGAAARSGGEQDSARSARVAPAAADRDFSADFVKARATQNADSERFYSTHRELPLRGQEAMQTYLTNAGFQFGAAQPELVGVDIYA
ncbi:MAG: hypothetical protein V7629_20535 [Motiliproteus sp.]